MNQLTNSIMRRHGGQPEGVKEQSAVGPSFLDVLFHQLQASKKSTPTAVIRAESCRPLFTDMGTGEDGFYEMPTYLRNRIHTYDLDNHVRAAAYADRVRKHIAQEAAA